MASSPEHQAPKTSYSDPSTSILSTSSRVWFRAAISAPSPATALPECQKSLRGPFDGTVSSPRPTRANATPACVPSGRRGIVGSKACTAQGVAFATCDSKRLSPEMPKV